MASLAISLTPVSRETTTVLQEHQIGKKKNNVRKAYEEKLRKAYEEKLKRTNEEQMPLKVVRRSPRQTVSSLR